MIERARIETHAALSGSEAEERMVFRATLMLRQRLNTAMTQFLVLSATVEIMEKRVEPQFEILTL